MLAQTSHLVCLKRGKYLFRIEICSSRHFEAREHLFVSLCRDWCVEADDGTTVRVVSPDEFAVRPNRGHPQKEGSIGIQCFVEVFDGSLCDQVS